MLFLSSVNPSPPATTHLPLFLPYKSPVVKFSLTEKTPFLGLGRVRPPLSPTRAAVPSIPEAEEQSKLRIGMARESEEQLVVKLRKLLMMSSEKRILLERISRIDLGLPPNFRDTICHKYPQFFKVVVLREGPALELTHRDPELAVSAVEEKKMAGLISGSDRPSEDEFRDLPYVSPYSDFSELNPDSLMKEKHSCAVVHEILSLTVGKTALVDNLASFRQYFGFCLRFRRMLTRHPELFSLSGSGAMQSVSLNPQSDCALLDARERVGSSKGSNVEERAAQQGRRWSNSMSPDSLDDDDWSDEDDDRLPDYFEPVKLVDHDSTEEKDEPILVLYPDGRSLQVW